MDKLVVLCVIVAFPLISALNDDQSNAIGRNTTDQQIQTIKEKFILYVDEWNVPSWQITWNPVEIFNNAFLTDLCANNVDGNYQNPTNCSQFFMCAAGRVYLWTCPAGGYYAPIPDQCVYKSGPNQEQCPWRSIWRYPNGLSCKSPLGQRPYWAYITFPKNRNQRCGQDVYYCLKNKQKGVARCAPGFGYSKCFLACIRNNVCNRIESRCA